MKKILLFIFGPSFLLQAIAFADTVTLKNGAQIVGAVESGGMREIQVRVGGNFQSIRIDQIQSIRFGEATGQPSFTTGQPALTLPLGTHISIRTTTAIESKTADTSKEYAASVDDPVVVNGVEVVPANATAFLRVTKVKNPRLGRASMSTALIAVIGVTGQRIDVVTDERDSQDVSHVKRTLAEGAAGAGAGAAIGAAVGGGMGAGIGAAVGGVGGALGGKALGSGNGVQIPSESRFTYTLTQSAAIGQ